MKIAKSVLETIGNTPLVQFTKMEEKISNSVAIFGKAESFNPGGSAKDERYYQ